MSWPADPGPGTPYAGGPGGGVSAARPDVAPTCYRHPDRETYIACQRCGRPICPDCMRPASVGFQCPQCVAEGNATVRQPRTNLGARVRGSGTPVTYALIALCVLVFLGEQVDSGLQLRFDMLGYAYIPSLGITGGVAAGQPYRLLTAIFLHESIIHIGLNMVSLYFVGRPIETALGRSRYLAVFFVGGLAGSAAAYLASPNQLSLGASGAIEAALCWMVLADNPHQQLPTHWWDGQADAALPALALVAPGTRAAQPLQHVLSHSFAFGGSNAVLALARA